MENLLFHDSGYGDIPKIPSKIEYDDDYRSEFLQNYLEVLYLSIRSVHLPTYIWCLLIVIKMPIINSN
jgi:beta-glucosidase